MNMFHNVYWLAEEGELLNRAPAVLNAIISSLPSSTSEIEALISQIRANLAKRRAAYSARDWETYSPLRAESDELYDGLDWLIANL